jgi:hypothetical protein
MPMSAHDFKRALTVDFFLQPPQRTIHRFAFFQSYFCQRNSLPFQRNPTFREFKQARSLAFPRPMSMPKTRTASPFRLKMGQQRNQATKAELD